MKSMISLGAAAFSIGLLSVGAHADQAVDPESTAERIRKSIVDTFPNVPVEEFSNGVYAIDKTARAEWEMINEFPPYEPGIEAGQALWETAFANGSGYADCFTGGPGVVNEYPRWDEERNTVWTLPLAINDCRERNGEKPLPYGRGAIAELLAYMAYETRGKITDVRVPSSDGAKAAYQAGWEFFTAPIGQLGMSCMHCHVQYAGRQLRSDIISPALGHSTGWPAYRPGWGELGTLHRRFAGCNEMTRARVYPAQSEVYRNLEYFLTHLSNGLPYNGPSSRK